MNDTKRPSNETITGANAYTVTGGNSVRAGGKLYQAGQQIPADKLNAADTRRLIEQGTLQAGNPEAEAAEKATAGTAAEVIDSLDGMDDAQLQAVADAENAREKPRTTVLKAIEAARARLADTGDQGGEGAGEE